MLVVKWKWNKVHFEAITPWANAHCELKVKQHSVWSYCSLSYCSLWTESETHYVWSYRSLSYLSLWTESETTFSLKLSLLELLFIVNWKWNNIQFEAIAPWAIVNWKWNNSQFEAIAPCAIAHCELKVKQHSVWSYCSLRYCSLWQNWKWNNIQFEAIAPCLLLIVAELKVKQHSVWCYCSLRFCLFVNWKWNNSQFEDIAHFRAIAHNLKGGESHRPSVADITPWAIARDLKRISFYRPKHYVLLTCKIPALSINTFSILYLYFFLLYLFKFCLLLKCSP